MASAKSSAKKTTNLKGVGGRVGKELTRLAAEGEKVHVLGTFKNGKLTIDQSSLEEMKRRFPNATMAFVAVNAPFDPTSDTAEVPAV